MLTPSNDGETEMPSSTKDLNAARRGSSCSHPHPEALRQSQHAEKFYSQEQPVHTSWSEEDDHAHVPPGVLSDRIPAPMTPKASLPHPRTGPGPDAQSSALKTAPRLSPSLAQILNASLDPSVATKEPDDVFIHIWCLPPTVDKLLLYRTCSRFGAVVNLELRPDPRFGEPHGYVQFGRGADPFHLLRELNTVYLRGKAIRAALYTPEEEREARKYQNTEGPSQNGMR